jgi:hypothetical protein
VRDWIKLKVIMMKVRFFTDTNVRKLEDEINNWMSEEKVGPSDIFKVCQTEDEGGWTVSVWYLEFRTVQSQ